MAYRMVYLRIQCRGYDPAGAGNTDLTAFKAESRQLFQEMGWTLQEGRNCGSIPGLKNRSTDRSQ